MGFKRKKKEERVRRKRGFVGVIKVGCSGYSYDDWRGTFYPRNLNKSQFLTYYSRYFDFAELNYTYYQMPSPEQMAAYGKFELDFIIKAHQSLTHRFQDNEFDFKTFKMAIQPLKESGRLGGILAQFPFSFHTTAKNLDYLEFVLEWGREMKLNIEFRNPGWLKPEIFDLLKSNQAGIVVTDAPEVEGGMPKHATVIGSTGYIRFHGRNAENWWTGNNASRYQYNYSDDEIKSWLPDIEQMASESSTLYIAFNNHAKGYAVMNALRLRGLLHLDEIPPPPGESGSLF